MLFFQKGKRFSLHYHAIKDETFYVYEGLLEIVVYTNPELDDKIASWDDLLDSDVEVIVLEPGDAFHVPTQMRHTARALLPTTVFEFSTEHFEEDSFRIIKGD